MVKQATGWTAQEENMKGWQTIVNKQECIKCNEIKRKQQCGGGSALEPSSDVHSSGSTADHSC